MAKQAQYISRPCKSFDSPALWDWLERYHPEVLSRFNIVFNQEARRLVRSIPPQYHELSEHIEEFVKCK